MRDLDDLNLIKEIDRSGMMALAIDFPRQCEQACEIADSLEVPADYKDINNIVILGMGGSGIGGDLLRSLLIDQIALPIITNRSYYVPKFLDRDSLVFVVSYSGNTEETLSAYNQALARDAKLIGITSGGRLKELCQKNEIPSILVPEGMPPRAALAFLFLPIVVVLGKLGLVADPKDEISEASQLLHELSGQFGPERKISENEAKQRALKLYNCIPIIYSSSQHMEGVAWRWKDQFNENSKILAFCNSFPELNHNEIVGWEGLPDKGRSGILPDFSVVLLRDKGDDARISRRMDITKSLVGKKACGVREVWSKGEGLLARIFSLVYLGDLVSIYLAILNGVDPTPIKAIDHLKAELAKK